MKGLQKASLFLIFILAFTFSGCTDNSISANIPVFTAPAYAEDTPPSGDTIKIASFNIQVFGKTKAGKAEVMQILATTISKFDIVAIQEIRDKSGTAIQKLETAVDALGTDYAVIIGPRLGRTSSKEQYAYIYRTDRIEPVTSYTYDDSVNDSFHREPFIAHFKAKSGDFDWVMVSIHTDPDEATEEINALPIAISDAVSRLDEPDVIVLGDFNADCTYFDETTLPAIFPEPQYMSLIPNDADTTVKGTVCTYDRIIITNATKADYAGRSEVYRFDTIYNLTPDKADDVSDHYPVWAEFYIGVDSE